MIIKKKLFSFRPKSLGYCFSFSFAHSNNNLLLHSQNCSLSFFFFSIFTFIVNGNRINSSSRIFHVVRVAAKTKSFIFTLRRSPPTCSEHVSLTHASPFRPSTQTQLLSHRVIHQKRLNQNSIKNLLKFINRTNILKTFHFVCASPPFETRSLENETKKMKKWINPTDPHGLEARCQCIPTATIMNTMKRINRYLYLVMVY